MKISVFMKGLIAIIISLSFAIVYFVEDSYSWLQHTYEVIQSTQYSHRLIMECQDSVRCYLLTKDQNCLLDYNSYNDYIMPSIDKLEKLTNDNNVQQIHIRDLRQLASNKVTFLEQTLSLAFSDKLTEASKLISSDSGEPLSKQIDAKTNLIINNEKHLLKEREASVKNHIFYAKWGIPTLCLLVVVISSIENRKEKFG